MHFVHHRSEAANARPILLIHGWPGSFIEFHAIIPKLTAAGYHVVAPSLPGYAFSSPPTRYQPLHCSKPSCMQACLRLYDAVHHRQATSDLQAR